MGKVKEKLLEDQMLNPDRYFPSEGETWEDYVPEIIKNCNKFGTSASDEIKRFKEEKAIKDNT